MPANPHTRLDVSLLAVVTALIMVGEVSAQRQTGTLIGQLVDETGGFLTGVTVECRDPANHRSVIAKTDRGGRFHAELNPGVYTVRFDAAGFKVLEITVAVSSGQTLVFDEVLQLATFTEGIHLEAIPRVEPGSMATRALAETINRFPKATDPGRIAIAAAGLNYGQLEGGWQANGASGAENLFLVDGIPTNSLINGAPRVTPSLDLVAEIGVGAGTITAHDPGAPGAVIDAVTRSGSNLFTGDQHYSFTGSELRTSPVPRLVLSPTDNTTVAYIRDAKVPQARHELGGGVGGPLKRNRLLFFAALTGSAEHQVSQYLFSSGAEKGELAQQATTVQALGKINFVARYLKTGASVITMERRSHGFLPPFNGLAPQVISSSAAANLPNRTRGFRSRQLVTQWDLAIPLSVTSTVDAHASYVVDTYKDIGVSRQTSFTYQTPSSSSPLPVPAELRGAAGSQNVPRAFQTFFDNTNRSLASINFSRVLTGFVTNRFAAGLEYQRAINQVNSSYPGGYVSVFWGSTFAAPGGDTGTGRAGYYEVDDVGLKGSAGANSYSVYVQDDLHGSDRLSLRLGVRLERETIPSFRRDVKANALSFGFFEKMAPRVEFGYLLMPARQARMRVFWGRFFDWTKYSVARDLFGGQIWRTYFRTLDDPAAVRSINLQNMPGDNLWPGPGGFRDNHVPSFRMLDPAVRPTYQNRLNVGFDAAVTSRTTFGFLFIYTTLQRPMEDVTAFLDGKSVYVLGNPGFGLASKMAAAGPTGSFNAPRPLREYTAIQLLWRKPLGQRWFAEVNYTFSRLYGNYSGLSNSDQVRTQTTGSSFSAAQDPSGQILREAGNLGRGWDNAETLFDSNGNLDVKGGLPADRPHVIKLFSSYTASFGTTLGFFQYAGSGTPMSTSVVTTNQAEVFVNGRGDMGRTPFLTQTDLLISQDLKVINSTTLRLELNMLNVFNQNTARHIFNYYNRGAGSPRPSSAISLANVDLANGYDYKAMVAATPDSAPGNVGATDPRYRMGDLFNSPFEAYVTAKFIF